MRTNADRAERGKIAFEAVRHDDSDDVTNLYDLICDMLHFADTLSARPSWIYDGSLGEFVIAMATRHYDAERAEEEDA